MKLQKYVSTLSLVMIGALYGAPSAWAMPITGPGTMDVGVSFRHYLGSMNAGNAQAISQASGEFTNPSAIAGGDTLTPAAGIGVSISDNGDSATAVAEPATLALLGIGLMGIGLSRRRKGGKKTPASIA